MIQKLVPFLFLFWSSGNVECLIKNNAKNFMPQFKYSHPQTTINKVSFTQKGYIQFLKYIDKVPPLTDYTFCIWLRSNNLTYSHPILSYSKHEKERLIRVWISPFGKSINLEILEHPVFSVPADIVENHWYHICQSWSANRASWKLFVNGKLSSEGYKPELKEAIIEADGDLVVGQEYTDFDKGLEDGIEGDIFGFNFVLAPTSHSTEPITNNFLRKTYQLQTKQHPHAETLLGTVPKVPKVLGKEPNRNPKSLLDMFSGFFSGEPSKIRVVYRPDDHNHRFLPRKHSRLSLGSISEVRKPLGLLLVELSFDCGLRKGAPLNGEGVLINWAKSPVRVFGGAILKNIAPFCV